MESEDLIEIGRGNLIMKKSNKKTFAMKKFMMNLGAGYEVTTSNSYASIHSIELNAEPTEIQALSPQFMFMPRACSLIAQGKRISRDIELSDIFNMLIEAYCLKRVGLTFVLNHLEHLGDLGFKRAREYKESLINQKRRSLKVARKMNSKNVAAVTEPEPVKELDIESSLLALGWKKTIKFNEERWLDPNDCNAHNRTPETLQYAWYVSRMRVKNRTDTKFLTLTNADLTNLLNHNDAMRMEHH